MRIFNRLTLSCLPSSTRPGREMSGTWHNRLGTASSWSTGSQLTSCWSGQNPNHPNWENWYSFSWADFLPCYGGELSFNANEDGFFLQYCRSRLDPEFIDSWPRQIEDADYFDFENDVVFFEDANGVFLDRFDAKDELELEADMEAAMLKVDDIEVKNGETK